MFTLRNKRTGEFVGWTSTSNDGAEFCVSTAYEFETNSDRVWIVTSVEVAEYARTNSTEWYNAGYETPTHERGWVAKDWEVVELMVKG